MGNHSDNSEWIKTQQASIELTGTVKDEDGEPLRGVTVRYSRDYLVPTFGAEPEPRREEGVRTISGNFRLHWSVAQHVHLQFEKKGYQPMEMDAEVLGTVPSNESGRMAPPAAPVKEDGLTIVLRR
jgi:hypothetical protein